MNVEAIVKVGTAVIALIGAVITYIIIPYIKSKTTAEQQKNIKFWVKVAVNAAEQIFQEKSQGQQKKQYVINFLFKQGIQISMEQLDLLIEATVLELNKDIKIDAGA
ncbi:phage holin, LLH family [Anaerophilus nitritogenes]|uniref:phage holin, LLH family n=1 Tax=Anaerophilus nitritogenes TaxID=2498136 RepID=UPI00101CA209|nr:phage holin, LLH family [Anaerophilus nitritogenes]